MRCGRRPAIAVCCTPFVDLDLARALEEAGDGSGAAAVRARAIAVLAPLRCVNLI